jgi:hypothetical protein
LPSGDRLVSLELSLEGPEGRRESVRVVWFSAPDGAAFYDTDAEVVVLGRVRRRFFRAGGATASRTEVVADAVLPAGDRRRVNAALKALSAKVTSPPGPVTSGRRRQV